MERHLVTGAHWGLKQHGEDSLEDTGAVHKMDWMSLSMLVLFWMCSVSILRIQGLSQPASCNVMQRACSRTFRDAVTEQLARWFLRQGLECDLAGLFYCVAGKNLYSRGAPFPWSINEYKWTVSEIWGGGGGGVVNLRLGWTCIQWG